MGAGGTGKSAIGAFAAHAFGGSDFGFARVGDLLNAKFFIFAE